MNQNPNTELVKEIMLDFAGLTGLKPTRQIQNVIYGQMLLQFVISSNFST